MQCFIHDMDFQIDGPTIVTVGKFDGRHRGHQKLINTMLERKEKLGYKTAIFSFDMSPIAQEKGKVNKVITTNKERRDNFEKMGIDYFIECYFTSEIAHMRAETFLKDILLGKMNGRVIVVGTDCSFGYKREGNVDFLKKYQEELGYELDVVIKEQDEERDISSTYVKEELDIGNIEKANELLGEPYAIHGTVIHGRHMGSDMFGFPTMNLIPPEEKYLPRFGVYVSRSLIRDKYFWGITNIGKKPTIEGQDPVGAETFVFGDPGDMYGEDISVELFAFLRPEIRFDSLEDLKEQLKSDERSGMAYLDKHKILC